MQADPEDSIKKSVLTWMGLRALKKSLQFQIQKAKNKGQDIKVLEQRLAAVEEAMRGKR